MDGWDGQPGGSKYGAAYNAKNLNAAFTEEEKIFNSS